MKELVSLPASQKVLQDKRSRRFKFTALRPRHLMICLSLTVLGIILICAAVPQWIAPYPPGKMFADRIMQAPSSVHYFGTDYFGRDVFSLVVYGSRFSVLIGAFSVLIGGLTGTLIGAVSGYAGGIADAILMRLVEVVQTIPGILFALAIAAAMGSSLFNIILAVSVAAIPGYARVMRGQIASIKTRPYVLASKSIGASSLSAFWKHVMPNSIPPLAVMASNGLGTAILTGAGLSFLGLGVVSEVPDWGALLSQGRGYLGAAWWIATFPGLAICVFVLAVNLIGDRLRDYFDPKKQYA